MMKSKTKTKPGITIERGGASISRGGVSLSRDKAKLGRNAPSFDSLFDDGDDNIFAGAEFDGDLQDDADTTMSEALRAVIERKKASMERFRVASDPEFYFCVCFQSREQKEDFLKKAGWESIGDGGRFLNGLEVARRLNIGIEVLPIEPLKLRGKIKRYKPDDILKKGE
jgi:hypothetical protein